MLVETQSDPSSSDSESLDPRAIAFRFLPYHANLTNEFTQFFQSDPPGQAFLAKGHDDLDRVIVAELNGWAMFYAVLDGHGNASVVDMIERRFPEYLASALMPFHPIRLAQTVEPDFDQIMAVIQTTIDQFEQDYLLPLVLADNGGAVAIMALMIDQTLIMINLGHARGVLFKSDGQVIFQTEDHLVKRPDENERITKLGGTIVWSRICCGNNMLSVSRAWGDLKFKQLENSYSNRGPVSLQADITRLPLLHLPLVPSIPSTLPNNPVSNPSEKIYLLLASNGLYKRPHDSPLSVAEMIQPLLPHPHQQAEVLLELAKQRSRDDVSFLLIPLVHACI